jgi:molecular chaperone GrpE
MPPMTPSKKKKTESTEVSKLKEQLAQANEARLRMAADYANLEKRIQEERIELLEKLFPIMDNLYRSSTYAPTISVDDDFGKLSEEDFKKIANYFKGLRLVEQQLEATLAAAGLERIPTKGQPFNHNLHEAISYENSTEVPAEHIIDEVESGWQVNGKVVKPAKVRVSQG